MSATPSFELGSEWVVKPDSFKIEVDQKTAVVLPSRAEGLQCQSAMLSFVTEAGEMCSLTAVRLSPRLTQHSTLHRPISPCQVYLHATCGIVWVRLGRAAQRRGDLNATGRHRLTSVRTFEKLPCFASGFH